MITIEFKDSVLDALKSKYPTVKNWESKLKHYENALNQELAITDNLRNNEHQLLNLYLISSHRLANNGGLFSQKRIRVHSVIKDDIKAFKVITAGSNISKQLTEIKLDETMMTITNETDNITTKILDCNDEEINEHKWIRELSDNDAKSTLYRLFPDIKTCRDYDGHELEVDLKSLGNYIIWLKTSDSYTSSHRKTKDSYITQATTILQVATLLSSDGITGIWPQKPKKSEFGRTYYYGLNIQNINKEMRRAILGESFQYDMKACAATWKYGYAKQLLIDRGLTDSKPELVFEVTRMYIGTKHERQQIFNKISDDIFDVAVTDKEKQQMLKVSNSTEEWMFIKNNVFTKEEQVKLLKRAFTAIQFGSRLTGADYWPDESKQKKYSASGLADIFKSQTVLMKVKENKIIKQFVTEQEVLEEYIINTNIAADPTLLKNEHIIVNRKVHNAKLLAYLFQHYETEMMDIVKEKIIRYEPNNKILASIHDAIIVRKKLDELYFINDYLRKHYNNPLIELTGEVINKYDTIPTQTKLNMIQEHKEHIKRETQEAIGYKSLLVEPSIDFPESNNIVDMWKDLYESYTNTYNE